MATEESYQNLVTQRHELYNLKSSTWKQVSDSYSGGAVYRDSSENYLHKFTDREPDTSYNNRKKRSIFFNNVQPLSDMLVGFLFSQDIIRNKINNQEVIEKIARTSGLKNFMFRVATNSSLYTTGVLVDSPQFNTDDIQTEGDRLNRGLNPYTILYEPWKILNFYFGADDLLEWILLDNSYIDSRNPFKQQKQMTKYTLWTRDYFQHFYKEGEFITDEENYTGIITGIGGTTRENPGKVMPLKKDESSGWWASEEMLHKQPEIPFIFVNWYDKNNDKIADTVFEDIAYFDQGIYNYMSLMDEMITGGTFKFLFYPGDPPKKIEDSGFANLAVIPFDPTSTKEPFFAGPTLEDINPFLNSIEFLLTGILRKLGLNTDQEKDYVQSGQAKFFDFKKTNALLVSAAANLERTEKLIFKYYGNWIGKPDEGVEIEYARDFLGVEQAEELVRMWQTMTVTSKEMRNQALKRIAEINFGGKIKKAEMNAIIKDIEKEEEEPTIDTDALINEEKTQEEVNARQQQ